MNAIENPYQTPSSNVEVNLAQQHEYEMAGKGRRFVNLLIDYVGFASLGIAIFAGGAFLFEESFLHKLEKIPDYLLGSVLMLLYYIPLEMVFGKTLGKLITGTRVVTLDGSHPTWK